MEVEYDDPRVVKIFDDDTLTSEEKNARLKPFNIYVDDIGMLSRITNAPVVPAAPVVPGTKPSWSMPNEFEPVTPGVVETAKDKYSKVASGNSITGNYSLSEDPMSFMFGGTQDGVTTKGAIPTAWAYGKSAWDIYASAESAKELEKNRLAQLAATQQGIDNKNVDQRNKVRRQNQLAGYGLTSGNSHANQALLYAKYRPEEYKKINLMQYA